MNEVTHPITILFPISAKLNGFRLSANKKIQSWRIILCLTHQSIHKTCLTHAPSAREYHKLFNITNILAKICIFN